MTFTLIDNPLGQLGDGTRSGAIYGDAANTHNRGDDPDEMGDNMDTVQFPTGFVPIKLVAGGDFNCVLGSNHSSNSSNNLTSSIVCWGLYVYIYIYSQSLYVSLQWTLYTLSKSNGFTPCNLY